MAEKERDNFVAKYNLTNKNLYKAAATVYGEVGNLEEDDWKAVGSSWLNRLGQHEWKNLDPDEILDKGYFAAKDRNDPYVWAIERKFPNQEEEDKFKKIFVQLSTMAQGKSDVDPVQFFFTKDEIGDLIKNEAFDFGQTQPIGGTDNYRHFRYREKTEFDPEGENYDYDTAEKYGMQPMVNELGEPHWGSRINLPSKELEELGLPEGTGIMLKGRQHETWSRAVEEEDRLGYDIIKQGERYYSVPRKEIQKKEKETPSFKEAFGLARKLKKKTFTWRGKRYTTKLKK